MTEPTFISFTTTTVDHTMNHGIALPLSQENVQHNGADISEVMVVAAQRHYEASVERLGVLPDVAVNRPYTWRLTCFKEGVRLHDSWEYTSSIPDVDADEVARSAVELTDFVRNLLADLGYTGVVLKTEDEVRDYAKAAIAERGRNN